MLSLKKFRHCDSPVGGEAISCKRSPRRFAPRNDGVSRGFTLIEIILVIALIGALGTWMISLIDPVAQFQKGRDAERKAELAQLQAAFELYRADKGEYPLSPLPECGSSLDDGSVTYIQKIPCDPYDTDYTYTRPEASSYTLVACLENVHDPKIDDSNDAACFEGDRRSYTVINP